MKIACIIPFLNIQLTVLYSHYQKTAGTSTDYGDNVITFQTIFEIGYHLESQYSIIMYWNPKPDKHRITKDGQRQVAMKSTSCSTKFYYLFYILISQESAQFLKSTQYFKHSRPDIR